MQLSQMVMMVVVVMAVVVMMVMTPVESAGAVVVPVVTTTGVTTSATLTAAAASLGAVALGATAVALVAASKGKGKGRYRRSLRDEKAEEVLAMVAAVDTRGCGMRHVCEVYKKPVDSLTPTENSIRFLIGEKPEPVSPSDAKHPWVLYQSAAILGQHGKDCYELYRACPLSPEQVNEYLATLDLE